jgi:PAS domain S-box-containing protein
LFRKTFKIDRLQQWFPQLASLLTATIAGVVLLGWAINSKNLICIVPETVPMHPCTAVAFLLLACALWLGAGEPSQNKSRVGLIVSGAVVFFSLARLWGYFFGGGAAIDHLLFPQTVQHMSVLFAPVRIQVAPNTAINFALIGTCLMFIHSRFRRFPFFTGFMLNLACVLLAILTISGWLVHVAGLGATIANIPMSLLTATAFLLLAGGMFVEILHASTIKNDAASPSDAPTRSPLENKVTIGFAAVLFMLCGIGIVSYECISQFLTDARWTSHTYQVIAAINGLYANMKDAEAAERGYIITGDAAFLGPQTAASQAALPRLEAIKTLTADNPSQQQRIKRIETAIAQRLEYFQFLIQIRRQNGFDTARNELANSQGVRLMDQIHLVLNEMRAEEDRLLVERNTGTETNARRGIVLIGCGAMLTLILVVTAGWVINRDITWRAQAEAALRTSETTFRGLLESAPDAMVIVDERGKIRLVNAQAEKLFDYSANELLGQSIEMLVPRRYRGDHVGKRDAYFASPVVRRMGAGQDLFGVRKDGSEFPVEVSLSPLRTAQGLRVSSAIRDITERKRAEEELRNFFTFSYDLLCIAGTDGYFKRLNRAWEKTLGYSDEELRTTPYLEFVHPQDRTATTTEAGKVADGRTVVQFENRYRCKDGSYRWLMWTSTLSSDQQRIYAAARDITDRKRQEEATQKLNDTLQARQIELEAANKELESFSYSVSHDLRAPLRAIDGFSQALLEDYGDKFGDDGKDSLQRVRAATQRMGDLIDDMLSLSRVTRSELRRERIDLSAIAKSIASELQALQPDRKVEFVIADGLECDGDPTLLRAALENLLDNSWKFTSKRDGARIEFGTTQEDQPAYFLRDNGAGFDMNFSQKLFGAFQRLHPAKDYPGTGVGLATVQRIILRHGGRIWAEAAEDKGATFYFTLNTERSPMARAA